MKMAIETLKNQAVSLVQDWMATIKQINWGVYRTQNQTHLLDQSKRQKRLFSKNNEAIIPNRFFLF